MNTNKVKKNIIIAFNIVKCAVKIGFMVIRHPIIAIRTYKLNVKLRPFIRGILAQYRINTIKGLEMQFEYEGNVSRILMSTEDFDKRKYFDFKLWFDMIYLYYPFEAFVKKKLMHKRIEA